MSEWTNIPPDFNEKNYILLNTDLHHLNEEEARFHYQHHGYSENRRYHVVPDDFNYQDYLILNTDLESKDEASARHHYEQHGYLENRRYKINKSQDNSFIMHSVNHNIFDPSDEFINHFISIYNCSIEQLQNDPKVQFRYICFKHIPYIKNIPLCEILEKSEYESVLIEYRCFPHLEFIIRNNILKLGSKWAHTVICGNSNYGYILEMCQSISPKIRVVKTPPDNLEPSSYSKMLSSLEFWNLLHGKKILINQEDSIIFKNNIDDFLYFDYVGAPWEVNTNDNKSGVGNGGISLRSKSVMIKIINSIRIEDTQYNSSTWTYIKNTNSFVPPEDVYFTKNMEDLNIGILADRNNASKFSTESIKNVNSLAGHNFWHVDKEWYKRLFKTNIAKFKPHYNLDLLEHRGGWKTILSELENKFLFSKNATYDFFDMMESFFLWRTDYVCKNPWCGIIHCTSLTPPYLNIVNIEYMFQNKNFIESLSHCVFIVSLSPYLTKYLHKKIRCELNFNIKIYTLYHPVVNDDIPLFSMESFLQNENKILIQIGQQLRKMSSIYLLNTLQCSKLWLPGTKKFERMEELLEKEIAYLKINKNQLSKDVVMYYTKTFEEYDDLLSKNIVFIELFDAAANNTVLECIIRNTPLIVNKIEGVVDYLGEDYPLYYTDLSEVPSLIDGKKILEAHEYLKNMNKKRFLISTFVSELFTLINNHFLKFY